MFAMMPPVGKSGPFNIFSIDFNVMPGFFTNSITKSHISDKLCDGELVAIPTAIPSEPFKRKFGKRHGSIVGSFNFSS